MNETEKATIRAQLEKEAQDALSRLGMKFEKQAECDACQHTDGAELVLAWQVCRRCAAHIYGAVSGAVDSLWDRYS